jgi:hypothetical protein
MKMAACFWNSFCVLFKKEIMEQKKFDFTVQGLPYEVEISPFDFNNEKRFHVSYNGGPEDTFVWDSDLKRLRAIDDDSSTLPDGLGLEISQKIIQMGF